MRVKFVSAKMRNVYINRIGLAQNILSYRQRHDRLVGCRVLLSGTDDGIRHRCSDDPATGSWAAFIKFGPTSVRSSPATRAATSRPYNRLLGLAITRRRPSRITWRATALAART